jgi:chromosome segregation ATPase
MNGQDTIHYAMAFAYENNSNMYECIKYVRKHYPQYDLVEDSVLENLWDAIDAYYDINGVEASYSNRNSNTLPKLLAKLQVENDTMNTNAKELEKENERLREYISDQITRLEVLKVTAYRLETALRESNDLLQEFDNIEEINIQILDNNVLMKDIKSGRYENAIRKIESIITGD